MAQGLSQKPVTAFNRGLVTEAGELTFPEGASVDELNCILNRDGSRRRRLGIQFETNHQLDNFTVDQNIFTSGEWKNVGGQAGMDYLVVQSGGRLYFYDKTKNTLSDNRVLTNIDFIHNGYINLTAFNNINAFKVLGRNGAGNYKSQFSSINGMLIVTNPAMNTIVVSYDIDTQLFSVESIDFKVRDFEWQGDTDSYATRVETASVSVERQYDTLNAGWHGTGGDEALSYYRTARATDYYPPLNLPWYSSKDADGNFVIKYIDGSSPIYSGNSLIANGHFVLDFFSKRRSVVSGLSIENEYEYSRFTTTEAFQGRMFYAGLQSSKNGGKILFSKIINKAEDLGKCYQDNDPTAELNSDLLATDGGSLVIPEATNIRKLYTFNSSLFVFADNGIWQIVGVDGIFRPAEFSVIKVANTSIFNTDTFVSAEGLPFWWNNEGIHTFTQDQSSGRITTDNLSISTIQSFYNLINKAARSECQSVYDAINKRILWIYPDNNETITVKKNNILVFDLALQAFYPARIEDELANTSYMLGADFYSGISLNEIQEPILTLSNDNIVDLTDTEVVVDALVEDYSIKSQVKFIVVDGASGALTFAEISNSAFVDWESVPYVSYAEGGYDFIGDMTITKSTPYITVYMRRTENGFVGDELTGYDYSSPSGMKVSMYWDFKLNPSTIPQQCYRLKRNAVVNSNDLTEFEYPTTVVTTRLKTRGSGKSMRLRFESEEGKDFILLGYEVLRGRNTRL